MAQPTYPAHWEADVVLSDGATAHLRPIRPDDADRLVAFYARVSDESKYYRFFAPYPQLSEHDIDKFTNVDHSDRVALILLAGDDMIAVGRYDRIDTEQAEVAFLVEDAHQGRGAGSVLLEHLAQAAREHGIGRFVAEVLPQNRKMIKVFADAGYTVGNTYEDGVVHVSFEIHPTEHSLAVMTAREHRAEARSIGRLLTPRSVAVVGASRSRDKVGQALVRNLVLGGFTGRVYAVNPEATAVAGVPAYPSVSEIPGEVDLVVIAVPAPAVRQVVVECAAKAVKGLIVVSAGFAETGEHEGRARQAELVQLARANGMRVVGPNCLGVVNTDPEYSLNASLALVLPPPGRVGFFSQSGALGIAILETVAERGLGLATFVSAGNRADVSGNDLLQYWQDDPATDVVLLYLESLGNPRKFARLARRVASAKPVVAVKSGRSTQGVPLGHSVRRSAAPVAALDALFRQSGVIRVDTLAEMFDAAQVLAYQPLPDGYRVAVVGNSDSIGLLAADAADSAGLRVVGQPRDLGPSASAEDFERAVSETLDNRDVDSIIVVYVPTLESSRGDEVARVLAATAAARAAKPIVSTFLGSRGVPEPLRVLDQRGVPGRGSIPSYPSAEEAARALAHATSYAAWRRRPHGSVPELADCDEDAARALVTSVLDGNPAGAELDAEQLRQLLACYGISLLEMVPAATVDDAIAAGARLEWDVVLKATAPHLRFRPDLADVWRNIDTADEMRDAWATLSRLADPAEAGFVVQKMAPPGIPVVIRAQEDDLFGPVVSFGMSGVPTDLLGDRAYRIPPLTDVDAREMVREVKAAPLLLGYRGGAVADLAAIEDLLHRVSRLTDDLPEVVDLELTPILVAPEGYALVNGSGTVAPPGGRSDWYTRRLE
jgi:acyl-CoA synthetase (NDP forming)/RimJ/RimL family protein N-acetyltransferase